MAILRMNDAAFNAMGGTMLGGTIIVKENHTPAGGLAAITVMYKSAGYDPDNGDWFRLKNTTDGSDDRAGMLGGCQDCHIGGAGHVFGPRN